MTGRIGSRRRSRGRLHACALVVALLAVAAPAWGQDWPPITPEEMALKDDPMRPGAPAIILYQEIFRDDPHFYERHHYRIKIFTDQGRKYADIEIPHLDEFIRVTALRARTVRPDGTVVPFEGKRFEKVLGTQAAFEFEGALLTGANRPSRLRYVAQTFALPGVEAGSIIEYEYTLRWGPADANIVMRQSTRVLIPRGHRWSVQGELSARRAHFSFRPFTVGVYARPYHYISFLPSGQPRPEEIDDRVVLELRDVPGLQEEEFMPPAELLKWRVHFFYRDRGLDTPEKFWEEVSKEWHKYTEKFIGDRRGIRRAAARLVSAGDSREAKLQKLYAHVGQIRNLSYERSKTAEELDREGIRDNNNVEDVLERGYGYSWEIDMLFVAMARAAGFEAGLIRVGSRDRVFFDPAVLDHQQLDSFVVVVRGGSEDLYLDPGTPFAPFGLLAWRKSGSQGLRLEKQGAAFARLPNPASADAVVSRQGWFLLGEDGTLAGRASVSFQGQEALERRLEAREKDDAARREGLEKELQSWFPAGARIEIGKSPNWASGDELLEVEFGVEVPNFAVRQGLRLVLPLGVFHAQGTEPFAYAERVHPVYFNYPWQETDEVTVEVPAGFEVEGLPEGKKVSTPFGNFEVVGTAEDGRRIQLRRGLVIERVLFPSPHYPDLRGFYSEVRGGDEQQAILRVQEVAQQE